MYIVYMVMDKYVQFIYHYISNRYLYHTNGGFDASLVRAAEEHVEAQPRRGSEVIPVAARLECTVLLIRKRILFLSICLWLIHYLKLKYKGLFANDIAVTKGNWPLGLGLSCSHWQAAKVHRGHW